MTEPTIAQLDAQIADLQRQRDLASLNGSKAVKAALVAGKVATLAEDLEALLPDLSNESVAAQQARNVISVIRNVRGLVDGEISRIEAMVEPEPEEPAA
ncbi:hypothetical protein [Sphingobium baderi]|uniref:Uncharacterized protein n=1 Tax=Sphingobium baderi LL03 TaxID=1114964 RepID=T0FZR9_9SPHN|nr:hypothetical protein [Sphingobium baderi]EQA96865.1 hypothetical protein L485_22555 [Sphingobium baderi LL03]KMS64126.1 hypothetical protein V475_20245 [Sphingobium baderi LL03]